MKRDIFLGNCQNFNKILFVPLAVMKLEGHIAFGLSVHLFCDQDVLLTFELEPLNLVSLSGLRSSTPD